MGRVDGQGLQLQECQKVDLSDFQKVDFGVVPHLCVMAKRLLIVANSECCVSPLLLLYQSAEEHI